MTKRVLKWDIPVDDKAHQGGDTPVYVMCQDQGTYDTVQLWTLDHGEPVQNNLYQVFATGQPIPDGAKYVGTAPAMGGNLIWHLFDVTDVEVSDDD